MQAMADLTEVHHSFSFFFIGLINDVRIKFYNANRPTQLMAMLTIDIPKHAPYAQVDHKTLTIAGTSTGYRWMHVDQGPSTGV